MREGRDSQSIQRIGFCGVWANRDAILEKTKLPQFRERGHLARMVSSTATRMVALPKH